MKELNGKYVLFWGDLLLLGKLFALLYFVYTFIYFFMTFSRQVKSHLFIKQFIFIQQIH